MGAEGSRPLPYFNTALSLKKALSGSTEFNWWSLYDLQILGE